MITGEEKLSPLLDKLAKKFEQVRKSAATADGVDKMAASLARVNAQMAAMEKFNAARIGFANARENFRNAERAVESAARAMRNAEGPARQLESQYRRAQSAVQAASRAFEMQKTSVLGAKRVLDTMGVPISRVVEEQRRLAAAVERANVAMEKQPGRASRVRSAVSSAAGTVGLLAGPAILHGTKAAIESGAAIQSKVVQMRAAGIPEADIQEQLDVSAEQAAKYTNVKRSDILERYKELRSVVPHTEEAKELLPTVVRANAAVNALDKSGHMAEGLQFAIKGGEILGRAQDPKRFTAYLDAFIKAQQVMGKTITPEHQFEFAKYLRASGATLSDRFVNSTGLSLTQELQSSAGTGIDAFVKQVVGGFQGQQHAAAKEFVALGLANKDDFETTKTGSIKGMKAGHHVKGWEVAQTDPDKYVYDYVVPALEKAGYKDQNSQIAEVRRLFTSRSAADVVAKLIAQRTSFENHAKLYEQAQGLNATENNQSDPGVALNSLTTSLQNFAGTVTSPSMQSAAGVLSGMASGIAGWAESLQKWQKNNPMTASVAGYGAMGAGLAGGGLLTYNLLSGLMGGFGLKGSAVALDGSAAALTAAAEALGGGSAAGKVANAATGGGAVAAAAGASPFALGAILRGGSVAAAMGGLAVIKQDSETEGQPLRTLLREKLGIPDPHEPSSFNRDKPASFEDRWGPVKADMNGETKRQPQAPVKAELTGSTTIPGLAPAAPATLTPLDRRNPVGVDDLGPTKTGRDQSFDTPLDRKPLSADDIRGAFGNVEAKLTGEAKVTGEAKITIDIPNMPSRTVNVPLRGTVSANGPGSLGTSSPDAAAAPVGVGHN